MHIVVCSFEDLLFKCLICTPVQMGEAQQASCAANRKVELRSTCHTSWLELALLMLGHTCQCNTPYHLGNTTALLSVCKDISMQGPIDLNEVSSSVPAAEVSQVAL